MSEPGIRDIDWNRFDILHRLWLDYAQAVIDRAEKKTWATWIGLKLAKSNYESAKNK